MALRHVSRDTAMNSARVGHVITSSKRVSEEMCSVDVVRLYQHFADYFEKFAVPYLLTGRGDEQYCGLCNRQLAWTNHVCGHVCKVPKELSVEELGQLNALLRAGGDTCGLCGRVCSSTSPHTCRHPFWRTFVFDFSDLPASSPALADVVAKQAEVVRYRTEMCGVVTIVFRAPPPPERCTLPAKQQLLSSPALLFHQAVQAKSSFAPGKGLYSVRPLNHEGDGVSLAAQLEYSVMRASGKARVKVVPILSDVFMGAYTGQVHLGPASTMPKEGSYLCNMSLNGGKVHLLTKHYAGVLVLVNMAHGQYANVMAVQIGERVLLRARKVVEVGVAVAGAEPVAAAEAGPVSGSSRRPQRAGQKRSAPVQASTPVGCGRDEDDELVQLVAAGHEYSFDYEAVTSTPGDPLLEVWCLCKQCDGKGEKLMRYVAL